MSPYERRLAGMPEAKRLYMLEAMPSGLARTGQSEHLHQVLTTYDFLKAKVDAIGVEQLIDDYELTTDAEPRIIQSALKACAYILLRDKGQFLVQLSGRMREQAVRSKLFTSYLQSHSLFLNFPTLAVNEEALVRTFTGHTNFVTKVFAGTNETFWSASEDGTVVEWDINSNQSLTVFNHPHGVWSVAASPDERYVISGDFEGGFYVWDRNTKELVNRIQTHNGRIGDIKFENEPRLLNGPYTLISGSGIAILWLFNQGRLIKYKQLEGHTNGVNAVLLDNKKSMAITGSWDNSILVFQFKLGRKFRLTGHLSGVRDVYYASDHNWLISASSDRTVRIWSLDSGLELACLEHGKDVKLTSVVRIQSRNFIVAGGEDGNLYFWEAEQFKFLGELAIGSLAIYSLSILNSKYLLTASEDQTIRAYDVMRIQPGKSFSHENDVSSVCITSADRAISISSPLFGERKLSYWDMATRELLLSISNIPPLVLQSKRFIDSSGRSQVVLCSEEGVYIWREGTSDISKLDHISSEWTSDAEFMPQRKILLICHDKALLLINTHKYELVMEIPVDGNTPWSKVAISPDELYIAHLVRRNGQINVYDVTTGKILWTKQHDDALEIEFSRENCLVTISENEIRLWSLTEETPLVTRPILHPQSDYNESVGITSQVAISNNREILVLTMNDFHVRIFNTATLELIATFTHRSSILTCAIGSNFECENQYSIVLGDDEGEVHFLQLHPHSAVIFGN